VVAKELLPLGRKPLIHHVLDEVERAGFTEATIVISPGKWSLRAYFEPDLTLDSVLAERGDEEALQQLREAAAIARRLHLSFVEQPIPAGLGDAVLVAAADAGDEPFGVLLPDDVIPGGDHWPRLLAVHAETGRPCFCVRPVPMETTHRFGIAVCSSRGDDRLWVEELVEKPPPGRAPSNLSVLGRYVVTGEVLDALRRIARERPPGTELQLTDGYAAVLASPHGVLAVPFTGQIFDSGTPDEYAASGISYLRAGAAAR